MRFRQRIWMLPLAATLVFIAGCAVSYVVGARTSAAIEKLRSEAYPLKESIDQFVVSLDGFRNAVQAAATEGDLTKIDDAKAAVATARQHVDTISKLPNMADVANQLSNALNVYESAALQAAQAMAGKGDVGDSMQRMTDGKRVMDELTSSAKTSAAQAVQATQDAASKGVRLSQVVLLLTGLVVLTVLGVASKLLISSTWKQLGEEPETLRHLVERIAGGDLMAVAETQTVSDGSLRASLVGMAQALRQTVSGIRQGTDAIANASQEISMGNLDLSTRTERTASSLQQTASAMEQMTASVRQTADSAVQASDLARQATASAQRGGDIVGGVVTNMDDISAASKKIGDIVGVIDSIAFQTNILALNAAVEAARAGEQGRGFAVVASEVRTLAQRSAQAAREIKTLIEESSLKVQDGAQRVDQAGQSMQEIVMGVRRVADIIGEITKVTTEQSNGIVAVNQSVGQLDEMTQQNAALVEQSAAAASSLQEQAAHLADTVRIFRVNQVD